MCVCVCVCVCACISGRVDGKVSSVFTEQLLITHCAELQKYSHCPHRDGVRSVPLILTVLVFGLLLLKTNVRATVVCPAGFPTGLPLDLDTETVLNR